LYIRRNILASVAVCHHGASSVGIRHADVILAASDFHQRISRDGQNGVRESRPIVGFAWKRRFNTGKGIDTLTGKLHKYNRAFLEEFLQVMRRRVTVQCIALRAGVDVSVHKELPPEFNRLCRKFGRDAVIRLFKDWQQQFGLLQNP
jgi:hypothetical protein